MELIRTIPTEVVQLLTTAEAAEYRLVPFRCEGTEVCCYGVAEPFESYTISRFPAGSPDIKFIIFSDATWHFNLPLGYFW